MFRYVLPVLLAALAPAAASAHDPWGLGFDDCDRETRADEAAAIESHLYQRFESPSVERRLRGEIAYSEARMDVLRRQLAEYEGINRFGTGSALALTADRVRLELRREEMIRRDLQDQLLLAQRRRRRARVVHAYAVQRATVAATQAARVGDGSITIVNH